MHILIVAQFLDVETVFSYPFVNISLLITSLKIAIIMLLRILICIRDLLLSFNIDN